MLRCLDNTIGLSRYAQPGAWNDPDMLEVSVELCCAVLCCAVLCCAVLCCAVLCCAVLCCAVLCCCCAALLKKKHTFSIHLLLSAVVNLAMLVMCSVESCCVLHAHPMLCHCLACHVVSMYPTCTGFLVHTACDPAHMTAMSGKH